MHSMRAVVFVDVTGPHVWLRLRECAAASFAHVDYISCGHHHSCNVTAAAPSHGDDAQCVAYYTSFVQAWQSARARACVVRADMIVYVTQDKTHDDADVVYALFVAQVVTLTLRAHAVQPPLSPLLYAGRVDDGGADDTCDDDDARDAAALRRFFATPSQSSHARVVVFEGGDGAGKATQTRLLVQHLTEDAHTRHSADNNNNNSSSHATATATTAAAADVYTIDYPHDASLYGVLLRVLLSGSKGRIADLDARIFSLLYSLNRYGTAAVLRDRCWRGHTVVCDRYYTANFGHQACKLPAAQRAAFIASCEDYEVRVLRLPRASVVFFLDVPPQEALRAMQHDGTRAYLDIHESAGSRYKQLVRQTYLWCCDNIPRWRCVSCCDATGQRYTREAVHANVYAQLQQITP